jgi:hypothetical protein
VVRAILGTRKLWKPVSVVAESSSELAVRPLPVAGFRMFFPRLLTPESGRATEQEALAGKLSQKPTHASGCVMAIFEGGGRGAGDSVARLTCEAL